MKTFGRIVSVVCLSLGAAAARAEEPARKSSDAKVRVGTYDSRAIVIAFLASDAYKASDGKEMADKQAEFEKAKADGNQRRALELEAWGRDRQAHRHEQGLGTAPIDDILEHIKDELPRIAKAAGIGPIVSKWDKRTLAKYESAELVDVTMRLVNAFHPTQRGLKRAIDIQKHAPVSPKDAKGDK